MLKLPQSYADRKHFFIVGALVLIGTVVLGFFLLAILPIKAQSSVQAEPIRLLFQLHLWLIAFLFSLVVVFMLYALVVFRRRKGDDSEENWSYQLNAAERDVLLRKMEEYCQKQTGMSLHDYAQQLREEPEQRQGPVMKL